MKIKDKKYWEEKKNLDIGPYWSCILRYAERWANLMESEIAKDKTVMEIAKETSYDANTEDLSWLQFSHAVAILAQCWKYGDELKTWYDTTVVK